MPPGLLIWQGTLICSWRRTSTNAGTAAASERSWGPAPGDTELLPPVLGPLAGTKPLGITRWSWSSWIPSPGAGVILAKEERKALTSFFLLSSALQNCSVSLVSLKEFSHGFLKSSHPKDLLTKLVHLWTPSFRCYFITGILRYPCWFYVILRRKKW